MIDQHTIQTLEFPKVISHIAGKCITPYGREEVERFEPLFAEDAIRARQSEISQMKDIVNFGSAFPLSRCEDCREVLDKTGVEGAFLDPKEILAVLELVEISAAVGSYSKDERENFPAIAEYLKRIRAYPELRKDITRAIDEDGCVRDRASSALRTIRNDLSTTKRRLMAKLDGILASRNKQAGWQDDLVTERNDRYVIPVLSGQYKSDEGILHDRSQSGATFYVEPKETVEMNNRLNLLQQEERAEIVRILRALTAEIAQRSEALVENTHLLGKLDSFRAAAVFANEVNGTQPRIGRPSSFDLVDARHPLLILQFGSVDKVVPTSLRIDQDRRALVITGPNTGGKTIALKTVGLMVLMAQSGLLIPADEKSTVGVFEQVYADIGDEQSIELSLSTFSSHIRNISRAIEHVSENSLALLDEIGVGTDPKEGAALAEAIVLFMVKHGARVVSSTHYSQLKTLALEHPEIENASLEFDRKTLAPTYRLQTGIPGSSYAVEIAQRLGIPETICNHAARLVGSSERSLAELIASLESELGQVRQDKIDLSERLDKARELEHYYRTQTEKFKNEIEETRREALEETDHLLGETRREVERLVAAIRRNQADEKTVKQTHRFLKDSRRKADKLHSKHFRGKKTDAAHFDKGDTVRIISLNKEGEIVELIGDDKARVRVGAVNTVVQLRNLEKLTQKKQQAQSQATGAIPNTSEMSPEIHLRGMTGEEAIEALEQYLDRAVVTGLRQVYVVHGKGTGALRRALTEFLNGHREVDSLRLGNWNEGGAGVTIVKLKS